MVSSIFSRLLEKGFLGRGLVVVQSLENVVVPPETWASRGLVPRDSLEILFSVPPTLQNFWGFWGAVFLMKNTLLTLCYSGHAISTFGSRISRAGCVGEGCGVASEPLSFCIYFSSWSAFRFPVIAVRVYFLWISFLICYLPCPWQGA